jgi:DNA polymerase III alpha subunit (gram-positive type)
MRPIKGHIPNTITSLTGISMNGHQMFYYMTPVESTDVISGLSSFVLWLEKINNPVLVAHNVLFDSRILLSSLLRNDIKHSHICGFADSLKLSKDIYPGRQSYKLGSIVRDVLKIDFDAHNAEADVEALTKLLLTVENLPEKLKIIPLHESLYNLERLKNEKTYLSTYDIFVSRKVVTKTTAKILAGSGLDSKYIEVVYRRSGLDGLETLIKNRMAKPAKTISNFIKYFAEINT